MPLYQVTAIDHDRGVRHTAYYEADGSEPISRLLAARGLGVLEIVMVVAVPDGFGIQRISPRRPALRDRDPVLHRLRLMVLGVLIGVALCLGVVFVLKAREHLTRTDIRPNLPTPPTGVATP